jgi:hypothetical protein
LDFWDTWLRQKGGAWPEDFIARTDPERSLDIAVEALIARPAGSRVRILDVGAGPLSVLGRRSARYEVDLVAVDALAEHYDLLLDRHCVEPPVRTRACRGEDVYAAFGEQVFDLVFCRNALDHMQDPLQALTAMLRTAKLGSSVRVQVFECEGERENYVGMHQWNVLAERGRLELFGPERARALDLAPVLGEAGEVDIVSSDGFITVTVRRSNPRLGHWPVAHPDHVVGHVQP